MEKQIGTILLILMLSCTTRENRNDALANSNTIDSTALPDHTSLESEKFTGTLFDKDKDFEILNSLRDLTKQSSTGDTTLCNGWTIEKQDIKKIIKGSEPINGPDWHHLFDVLPCILKGKIIQDGLTYGFEVNAGAWLYISSKDTTFILGSFEKKNKKYFVSNPMTSE